MEKVKMYNRLLWDCISVINYHRNFKVLHENRLFHKNINIQLEEMKKIFFSIPKDKRDKKRLKQLLRIEKILINLDMKENKKVQGFKNCIIYFESNKKQVIFRKNITSDLIKELKEKGYIFISCINIKY